MAVSENSYFSNAIQGYPGLGADIDVFDTSSTPKFSVGFGFTRGDGSKFRYGHFGALTGRGAVVSQDKSESSQTNILKAGALVANITKPAGQLVNANAVNSKYAQLVITATNDQFAGGYLVIHSGTGFGFTYRIKGNEDTSDTVTGNVLIELYDPIQVALDSNSEIAVVGSPYSNLEAATTTDPIPSGISVQNQTAAYYGWIQTRGPVGALSDVTIGLMGKPAFLSTNTTGAVSSVTGTLGSVGALTTVPIGYFLEPGTSASYATVFVTLE